MPRSTWLLAAAMALMSCAGLGATATAQLAAPDPTAPEDGAFFDRVPRTTTLRWQPVQGAAQYRVEIENCARRGASANRQVTTGAMCSQYCDVYGDRGDCGYVPGATVEATATEYTFDFGGASPGRWRVSAIDGAGHPGPPSPWSEFAFTDGTVNPGYVRPAHGAVRVSLRAAGVRFTAPRSWERRRGRAPEVYVVESGAAVAALWRYRIPADEQSPTTHSALVDAEHALVKDVRRRDHTFTLDQARLLRVSGHPAVQILGVATIDGDRRRVRSTHIYTRHAEYVVDAFAPEPVFDRADQQVFVPLLGSVKIFRPR